MQTREASEYSGIPKAPAHLNNNISSTDNVIFNFFALFCGQNANSVSTCHTETIDLNEDSADC